MERGATERKNVMPIHLATVIEGVREVHARGPVGGICDADTGCGIDMDDPKLGHHFLAADDTSDPIDCAQCIAIYNFWHGYKPKEFKQ